MEIKEYCKYVDTELTMWKARLYDVMRKIETLPSGNKQRMHDEVNGLNIVMAELEERIDKLRSECPLVWKPEQDKIKEKFSEMTDKYKETTGVYFDYDFGG